MNFSNYHLDIIDLDNLENFDSIDLSSYDLRVNFNPDCFYRYVIRNLFIYRNKHNISFQYLILIGHEIKLVTVHTTSIKLKEEIRKVHKLPEFSQYWVEVFTREKDWEEYSNIY